MKHLIKKITLIIALCAMTVMTGYAQASSKVEEKFNEFVKKYENTEGVSSMSVVKGRGLELVKMMFSKELGKNFMKGVTSITVIDYSNASQETCMSLRNDLDSFVSLLEEFNLNNEEVSTGNDYLKCFASSSDSNTISDFIFAMEDESSKTIMYMAGTIKVEE